MNSNKTSSTTLSSLWVKMSGAGNTFWISDFFKKPQHFKLIKDWKLFSQKICRKEADGLSVLFPPGDHQTGDHKKKLKLDFRWLFFNSDGSCANMCGNAACSVLYYAFQKKLFQKKTLYFQNDSFTLRGEIKKNKPYIFFNKKKWSIEGPFSITIPKVKGIISYFYTQNPIPHALVQWPKHFDEKELKPIGSFLRKQKQMNPEGMNVTFFKTQPQNHVKSSLAKKGEGFKEKKEAHLSALTYERGVEGFTKACGTGALALATYLRAGYEMTKRKKYAKPYQISCVNIEMPGGKLRVDFLKNDECSLHSPVTIISTKKVLI